MSQYSIPHMEFVSLSLRQFKVRPHFGIQYFQVPVRSTAASQTHVTRCGSFFPTIYSLEEIQASPGSQ